MKKIGSLLPNLAILICNMFFVFFAIDQVNTFMAFVDNKLTKSLLILMFALSLVFAARTLADVKREERRAAARRRKRARNRRKNGRGVRADA